MTYLLIKMENILEIIKRPLCVFYDSDRHRRSSPEIYGRYKPNIFKRFICWLMDEKIHPIDWEEVPPYIDSVDKPGVFIQPREGRFHPIECVSQPDMISEDNQLIRYFLAFIFFFCLHIKTKNNPRMISKIPFFRDYYFFNLFTRAFITTWMFYIITRNYVNKNNIKPYN